MKKLIILLVIIHIINAIQLNNHNNLLIEEDVNESQQRLCQEWKQFLTPYGSFKLNKNPLSSASTSTAASSMNMNIDCTWVIRPANAKSICLMLLIPPNSYDLKATLNNDTKPINSLLHDNYLRIYESDEPDLRSCMRWNSCKEIRPNGGFTYKMDNIKYKAFYYTSHISGMIVKFSYPPKKNVKVPSYKWKAIYTSQAHAVIEDCLKPLPMVVVKYSKPITNNTKIDTSAIPIVKQYAPQGNITQLVASNVDSIGQNVTAVVGNQ